MIKNIFKSILVLLIVAFSFTSCNDFLDRPPMDSVSENDFFKNESQVRIYSYGFYTTFFSGYGSGITLGPFLLGERTNDDFGTVNQDEFAPIYVPASDGSWSFGTIRSANLMIQRVTELNSLSKEAQNHWLAVARFFRASDYCRLTFLYGDVPYMDRVSNINPQIPDKAELDYLYKDRDPRAVVVRKNIEDFRFALANARLNDGAIQINRYVIAAYVSRMMLREGTYLKYHDVDQQLATECLTLAKEASEIVMNGPFKIADSFKSVFVSNDLASNTEVILYRKYLDGKLMHSTLAYCNTNTSPAAGASNALMEAYLGSDGLPVYKNDINWKAPTAAEFFANRDPRLAGTVRERYFLSGISNTPFDYSITGYSINKFMDDNLAGTGAPNLALQQNVTDAPVLRLGEVLVNYAEICYELGNITQADLDKSINKLRGRKGVEMPKLEIIGGLPAVGGVVYDDIKRDQTVPALLWEIRRERRVELAYEGFRNNDLIRWKKLDYMYNGVNPDLRRGAYIRYADYQDINKKNVVFETEGAVEGFILTNTGTKRMAPTDKNYIKPVPSGQIELYKKNGYTLTQTPQWQGAQ